MTFVPTKLPELDLDDDGPWRDRVTAWLLIRDEIDTGAKERFTAQRWAELHRVPSGGRATKPTEALDWIVAQRLDALHRASDPEWVAATAGWSTEHGWRLATEMTWWMLTRMPTGKPGGGVAISTSRSVDIYADPVLSS